MNDSASSLIRQNYGVILAAIGLPAFIVAYRDYRGWYNLGKGGVPHNIFGWTLQTVISFLFASKDLASTACYDAQKASTNEQRFLEEDLPQRAGSKPSVGRWIFPHRQTDSVSSPELKEAIIQYLQAIASAFPTQLAAAPSVLEGGAPALQIHPSAFQPNHAHTKPEPREIFHIHPSEGSFHVILSATDAVHAIERGWAIRHPLAGKGPRPALPITYLMVFAPRDEGEVEVVQKVVRAAARYALEGKIVFEGPRRGP